MFSVMDETLGVKSFKCFTLGWDRFWKRSTLIELIYQSVQSYESVAVRHESQAKDIMLHLLLSPEACFFLLLNEERQGRNDHSGSTSSMNTNQYENNCSSDGFNNYIINWCVAPEVWENRHSAVFWLNNNREKEIVVAIWFSSPESGSSDHISVSLGNDPMHNWPNFKNRAGYQNNNSWSSVDLLV